VIVLKVALCDDDKVFLYELAPLIEKTLTSLGLDIYTKTFTSVKQMQSEADIVLFDVFFLDIDMPEADGVEFGAFLRKCGSEACIVFVSNRNERVFDTFRTAPLRFICKNRLHEDIDDTAEAILEWWEKRKERSLLIMVSGQYKSILLDDIFYIECFGRKQDIVAKAQTITATGTMSELESRLLNCGFIKPHRGYLVNYKHITSFKSSTIQMRNGIAIPVSRNKLSEVKQTYMRLVAREPNIIKYSRS
jgi:DNA-binding LytR/AlgR family response regulator